MAWQRVPWHRIQVPPHACPLSCNLQDTSDEDGTAATAGTAASDASPSSALPSGRALRQEWEGRLLPALVGVLQQRRGQHLQESKEAAAGVLAKYAANGEGYAAAVG